MKRANRLMHIFGVIQAESFVVVLAFGSLGQAPPPPEDPQVPIVAAW